MKAKLHMLNSNQRDSSPARKQKPTFKVRLGNATFDLREQNSPILPKPKRMRYRNSGDNLRFSNCAAAVLSNF